ncbi:MAG: LamG domain-containing protein, partial [Akkermansiaceae bacterium]|nr:LamG domain-containing protein [Akkermansiaceae bacterium]
GQHSPWLVCKNPHEQADGNYGIVLRPDGFPEARLNIGGGRENAHHARADRHHALRLDQWNHVVLSYDGDWLRLHVNGQVAAEQRIGKKRVPKPGGLTFGGRQDGPNFPFRGVVDGIRLYDRALALSQVRALQNLPEKGLPHLKPVKEWTFREDVAMSPTKLSEQWKAASLELRLANAKGELGSRWILPAGETWETPHWQQTALMIDPVAFKTVPPKSGVTVEATEIGTGASRPVHHDPSLGWHRVNLDGIEPVAPPGVSGPSNDALERVKLVLSNPTDTEAMARLMFEKTARGFRQRIGTPITGISAILRDAAGNPTGVPVQLSKNWHNHREGGTHSGAWFHGITQLRLPPASTTQLELTICYGHWGGVPAASHAQLSLIGWGGNALWDQSALGSWGESICYDPGQVQAGCTITDVRPVMVRSKKDGKPWTWTNNVGGGDFFRFFDRDGERLPHAAMRTSYHRQGPCLTEVTYAGRIGEALRHSSTVSLARTDDVVRGVYKIRLDVKQPADFSRFVIFQVGADTYYAGRERKMAIGNETGVLKEWETRWGGGTYRTAPVQCTGRIPWASLHDAVSRDSSGTGALANRGLVIRSWKARLGGKAAAPWIAERGVGPGAGGSSTLDLLPPPGVTRLVPGDFVEATIEYIVMPQFARDYYGPNEALRSALARDQNTWRMIHREATGNDRRVNVTRGSVEQTHPDVRIRTEGNEAAFTLAGGLGHVPVTFTGLTANGNFTLAVDGKPVDQSVHGNDFWQADYDPATGMWSRTYNLPLAGDEAHPIRFSPTP